MTKAEYIVKNYPPDEAIKISRSYFIAHEKTGELIFFMIADGILEYLLYQEE